MENFDELLKNKSKGSLKAKVKLLFKKEFLKSFAKERTIKEICDELQISYTLEKQKGTVRKFLEKNKIEYKKKKIPDIDIEAAKFLYEKQHKTIKDIARYMGVSYARLEKHLKKEGVAIRTTNTSFVDEETTSDIREMIEKGKSITYIARVFGFNYYKAKRLVEDIENNKD